MPDIHQLYRIALEAALSAELISLKARKSASKQFPLNASMQLETQLLDVQISAIEDEIKRLDQ